jgi:hypothetical protein
VSDCDPIEDALRKLRPAELQPALMARLSAARPHTEAPRQKSALRDLLLRWLLPVTASAGVAVATFALLEHHRATDSQRNDVRAVAATDASLPVESQDYLMSARPVGIVVAPDQRAYRIMDVQWLEHQTVRENSGGPVLHTATTRRDVIPVALELY